ncbi:MAG: hypothetical protein KJO08_05060, partial [Gammaproteobacteria bacterium]|nr:hypothetical protein [Gammaproteobacteria bacterium]
LMERDADTEKVDNAGFNAFLIALDEACRDEKYAARKLAAIYEKLSPDSISIQVDGKLVKLDNHLMEFLMLSLMMVMFYTRLGQKVPMDNAIESGDFVEVLAKFPNRLVPDRRKKRPYISSILSKNEVDGQDRYNRKLFLRVKRGNYIINPKLSVRVEGEWRKIYDLLSPEMVAYRFIHEPRFNRERVMHQINTSLQLFRDEISRLTK